jgi:hypothetical protein
LTHKGILFEQNPGKRDDALNIKSTILEIAKTSTLEILKAGVLLIQETSRAHLAIVFL